MTTNAWTYSASQSCGVPHQRAKDTVGIFAIHTHKPWLMRGKTHPSHYSLESLTTRIHGGWSRRKRLSESYLEIRMWLDAIRRSRPPFNPLEGPIELIPDRMERRARDRSLNLVPDQLKMVVELIERRPCRRSPWSPGNIHSSRRVLRRHSTECSIYRSTVRQLLLGAISRSGQKSAQGPVQTSK
jgi:hypothetical protein